MFLTGTRADYGKLKPLMRACEYDDTIENYIYAIGMHLLDEYGYTINEILKDGYKRVYYPDKYVNNEKMELNLAETIVSFSDFISINSPDLIVVHGDRVEPLAGAIVGVMNNIPVAHVEGGELSGTADEFMRHAISKLSNIHFVSNEEAKYRLLQLGEKNDSIHVIGSPDIDIMLKNNVQIDSVKTELSINFDSYAILIYHPVTTSDSNSGEARQLADAVLESGKNYIVVSPNNDKGNELIRKEWNRFNGNDRFLLFDSIPFEFFLSLLKNSDFIIGNSSAGIREACVYGVPAIDVGTRQQNRYKSEAVRNIQHCNGVFDEIIKCINGVDRYRIKSMYYGEGNSSQKFMDVIKKLDKCNTQKQFVDTKETSAAIINYINEVCY